MVKNQRVSLLLTHCVQCTMTMFVEEKKCGCWSEFSQWTNRMMRRPNKKWFKWAQWVLQMKLNSNTATEWQIIYRSLSFRAQPSDGKFAQLTFQIIELFSSNACWNFTNSAKHSFWWGTTAMIVNMNPVQLNRVSKRNEKYERKYFLF